MEKLYVFMVALVSGAAPNGLELQSSRKDCVFSPLSKVNVFSIDIDCWPDNMFRIDTDCWSDNGNCSRQIFFPEYAEFYALVKEALASNMTILMGLTEEVEWDIPGRGHKKLERLESFPEWDSLQFKDLGYDVIDYFGLSALINIGFPPSELDAINKFDIKTNEHGLIESIGDGFKFSKFSDSVAKEHSPFHAVKVVLVKKD